ncbi:MAG: carboxylic ester hydrolase, partial [Bdellovibrionales bacterium]|nr:carboxylic ester hydrolase [Massilia sp.]
MNCWIRLSLATGTLNSLRNALEKMRSIEALLALANLVTFLHLTVLLPRNIAWMRYSALIALLIAIAQVLLEGARWQIIPAYVLTGVFLLVWRLKSIPLAAQTTGQAKGCALFSKSAACVGILGLALAIALPIVLPVFHLERPSGPYQIGTLTYHWVDQNRAELFSAEANVRRELMVQIWYPAQPDPSSPRTLYVHDSEALSQAFAQLRHWPRFALTHLRYVTSHAVHGAAISNGKPNYPVLIFMEGLTGFRQMNTFQVEELVSHGYVVAAIDQPYVAATVVLPDGRRVDGLSKDRLDELIQQSVKPARTAPRLNGRPLGDGIIAYLAQDAAFTLDRMTSLNQADPNGVLTGRLDITHAGIFGISLGGIAVSEACRTDLRFRA